MTPIDPSQVRAVVLDCDGVVLESAQVKTAAFRQLFSAEAELEAVVAYHLAHTGVPRHQKFVYVYEYILKRPLDAADAQRLSERFSAIVAAEILRRPEVPGLRELLREASETLSFYVASATPHSELRSILSARGLLAAFVDVVGFPTSKAETLTRVKDHLGLDATQLVLVGDSHHDRAAAESAGVPFIARRCEDATVRSSDGLPTIDDLHQLRSFLRPALSADLAGLG